jgi:hypothetical protein
MNIIWTLYLKSNLFEQCIFLNKHKTLFIQIQDIDIQFRSSLQ